MSSCSTCGMSRPSNTKIPFFLLIFSFSSLKYVSNSTLRIPQKLRLFAFPAPLLNAGRNSLSSRIYFDMKPSTVSSGSVHYDRGV